MPCNNDLAWRAGVRGLLVLARRRRKLNGMQLSETLISRRVSTHDQWPGGARWTGQEMVFVELRCSRYMPLRKIWVYRFPVGSVEAVAEEPMSFSFPSTNGSIPFSSRRLMPEKPRAARCPICRVGWVPKRWPPRRIFCGHQAAPAALLPASAEDPQFPLSDFAAAVRLTFPSDKSFSISD